MRVGAVVLHHRFWPGVSETLRALQAQTRVPDRVVVVDNGSGPGEMDQLRQQHPGTTVLTVPNEGYAHGMNRGVAALGQVDAVLLLTHEAVLAPGALAALAARLEQAPDVGLVGPLLGRRSDPRAVWSAGGGLGRRTARAFHHQDPARVDDWGDAPVDVTWVDGAAVLVRREVLERLGGLDERFFLYVEELDLALRARRQGWRVECVPAAVGWQEPAMAPPYLAERNRLLLLRRTPGLRRFLPVAAAELLLAAARSTTPTRRRELSLRLAGARDAVSGRLRRELARRR